MWPTLIEADSGLAVHTYGVLVLLGLASSMVLVAQLARRMGMPMDRLPLAFLAAAGGGLLGAKVLYALGTGDPASLFQLTGGIAWYGGLLGGTAAVLALRPVLGIDPWKLADATVPAIALGGGIGRLGCFFAGCCHGVPLPRPDPRTALLPEGALHGQVWLHPHAPFLSTEFHEGVGRYLHVPLYPTQVWQAAGSFLLAGLLLWAVGHRRFDGQVAGLFLVTEPVLRFVVEAFRGDHRGYAVSWPAEGLPGWLAGLGSAGADAGAAVVGLTTSQGIALAMIPVGVAVLVLRRRAGVAAEVVADDAWVDDLAGGDGAR